jgi:ubiquinone/menaquinone biosynthesis C-methylase UbiE
MSDAAAHWADVYVRKDPGEVSWYESTPKQSLALIESTRLARDAPILDVGGGASSLAARLVESAYTDVTVADISSAALEKAQSASDGAGRRVTWIQADIRTHQFSRRYKLWHDRAVFHFMVAPEDRDAYLENLSRTLEPGGHLILATFGPGGPERCSRLPVVRYDAAGLAAVLGAEFEPVWSGLHAHRTPSGASQQFLYTHFMRKPARAG